MLHANGWLLVWIHSLPALWQTVVLATLGLSFVGGIIILAMVSGIYRVIHWDRPG